MMFTYITAVSDVTLGNLSAVHCTTVVYLVTGRARLTALCHCLSMQINVGIDLGTLLLCLMGNRITDTAV